MAAQIYKLKEYDLLATALKVGNYYFCTDSLTLYKDTASGRHAVNAVVISTELDRLNGNVTPVNGKLYYVYETNELWLYNAGWSLQIGTMRTSSGYFYDNSIIDSTTDINEVLDNNGLLRDGSVCVRDSNRIIKGKMYIDGNNNLIFSSFLGGGIKFYPAGSASERGALEVKSIITYSGLNEDGNLVVNTVQGELNFNGNMYTVNENGEKTKVITRQDLVDLGLITG